MLTYSERGKLGYKNSKIKHAVKLTQRISDYNLNPTLCAQCHQALPYLKRKGKFCNRSCSATFNNTGRNRHGTIFQQLEKKEKLGLKPTLHKCANCDNLTNIKRIYCSQQCWDDFKLKEVLHGNAGQSRIKKYLLNQAACCSVCKITEWEGKPITFDLDHIDGNPENNSISNCRLLCPNCHSQTATYKGKNKGKGRATRRERYKVGKSY